MTLQTISNQNKNLAMLEYLRQCPVLKEQLKTFLHTNTTNEKVNNASFNTIYSDVWETKYLHGHGVKLFDFAISLMLPFDVNRTDNNAEQLQIPQQFMAWIDEQDSVKNFPDFEGCKVLSISNLQNMPNFAGVNEEGNLAKYMFQCRVKYQL